jgi:molybdopterin converting factor small subunit
LVNIEYLASFRLITGKDREQVLIKEKCKLEDLIENMVQKHGNKFANAVLDKKTGALNCLLLINGKEASLDSYVNDADTLAFLIPIAGG